MAELLRIRQVVDAADRAAGEGRTLLYLLDEILRGTNTKERQIAVRRALAQFVSGAADALPNASHPEPTRSTV